MGCVRILHLEDSLADAQMVREILAQEAFPCKIAAAPNRAKFEAALEQEAFDLILCDHGIPGYDGFSALRLARQRQPHVPVIMFSGTLDEAHAVESLKSGATDYILKQRLARLVPAMRRALQEARERKRQQAADERIREQASLLDLTRDAIVVRNLEDRIIFWNQGAELLFGWSGEEALGQEFGLLLHGDTSLLANARKSLLEAGDWLGEMQTKSKTGQDIVIFSRWNLLRDKNGQPQAILSALTDVTEKKKLEAVLLRAQRMDSIGALAGGIAHDLNNALAPVLMCVELLKSCQNEAGPQRFLDIITSSTQRASGMVKQILGFARGNNGNGSVSVGDVVREMSIIVKNTFPKSISICAELPSDNLWRTRGDTTALHQVLLNLCVNARDAMPNGGRLTLSAQNVKLDEEAAGPIKTAPGPYVLLSVADTGSGIPPEVLPRIYEPFFTTKSPGTGTGLGLSTVATIVKQYDGRLDLKTKLGQGTEFKIYFPAMETAAEVTEAHEELTLPVGHGELILVVEDEEAVRELIKTTLENYGYTVVTAQNGVQGISLFEEHKRKVRALITDTDMPYLDGMAAIDAIKALRPDLPVIIASGSQRSAEQLRKIDVEHLTNLGKPFSVDQLLIAVGMVVHN
jgi:two-component system, cell cycle sensor histidine kinase and response regulator CckA